MGSAQVAPAAAWLLALFGAWGTLTPNVSQETRLTDYAGPMFSLPCMDEGLGSRQALGLS